MKLGIVGHEEAKFTDATAEAAGQIILDAFRWHRPDLVVSGGCHLGGIDIWAEQLAKAADIETLIHEPKVRSWSAPGGYRDRNLKIARDSDVVLCIVVKELPPEYRGMRFDGCYHCRGRNPPHVKSGGCWTAWRCEGREWRVV